MKQGRSGVCEVCVGVAPHAGAWIETIYSLDSLDSLRRRPPRGGVD
mgnify:CR=1 FL=1